ncbi:uncharacterized protein phf11 [Enoplosus armatus]|uniref:uncharacterized protein phf11 n=1 Tax=Enoplosus armatus TaxID=215367 RepID=UPI003991578B
MGHGQRVPCVLCNRSGETKITGPLSTKDQVTAHQNCLLFSSGIYCRDSPFDDLFGFSVDDVKNEVKRGSKLICNKCKKKGATAGCEVKRCKKSYHYPCALQEGAKVVEDADKGKYGLYCLKHKQKNNGSVNGCASSSPKPGPSKDPNDPTEAGPSVSSSDSNSSISATRLISKRRLSFNDKQEETPSKRKAEGWKMGIFDSSSNSDEDDPNTDMAMFGPLEFDLDESANSVSESQDTESESLLLPVKICLESQSQSVPSPSAAVSIAAVSPADPSVNVVKRDGEGSISEQSPVHSPGQHTAEPSVLQQSSAGRPPSPDHAKPRSVTGSPPCTSSAISPAPPETICLSLLSSSPSPTVLPSVPEPSIDSTSFWKSCNEAGCTQAIFTGFINEMNDISSRIQSDQASQEDYDLALTVMSASGKLAELVTKQQEELQRKQMELRKAAAAMKDVVSALKTRVHQQLP